MSLRFVVLPLVVGLAFIISREIGVGAVKARGVVSPWAEWTLKVEGGDCEERIARCGVSSTVRRWRGLRGEQVVVTLSESFLPGRKITKGQEIARLTFPTEEFRRATAQARLKEVEARLRLLRAGARPEEIEIAQAEVSITVLLEEQAAAKEAIASSLLAGNLVSSLEYETMKSKLAVRKKEAQVAQAELTLLKAGPTAEETAALEAEATSLEAELRESAVRAEATAVLSPFDGAVGDPTPGFMISVQQTDTVMVSVPLDQEASLKTSIGAEVEIRGPGSLRNAGTVVGIAQTAALVGDKVKLSVQVVVPNPGSLLRPGMTVEANIRRRS